MAFSGKPRILLFAAKHISPGTELRYSYGGTSLPWRKVIWSYVATKQHHRRLLISMLMLTLLLPLIRLMNYRRLELLLLPFANGIPKVRHDRINDLYRCRRDCWSAPKVVWPMTRKRFSAFVHLSFRWRMWGMKEFTIKYNTEKFGFLDNRNGSTVESKKRIDVWFA